MRCLVMALLLTIALTPLSAQAHTFDVPDKVTADPDGNFSIPVEFTAGPGDAEFASFGWGGLVNISNGLIGDCFCLPECLVPEGSSLQFSVDWMLDDPTEPGLIAVSLSLCYEPGFSKEVVVNPFVVSTETVNWSAIKARFQ